MFTNFEFANFMPTPELRTLSKVTLSGFQNIVPEQFSSRGTLTRVHPYSRDLYKCHMELYSGWGIFMSESSSESASTALDEAAYSLKRQIQSWVLRRSTLIEKGI